LGFWVDLRFPRSVFPYGFCQFFCAFFFLPYGDFDWFKKNTRPKLALKNETAIISSGNQNAESGFETEKHLFFPNPSFANSYRGS
jgi:hypothetical protein